MPILLELRTASNAVAIILGGLLSLSTDLRPQAYRYCNLQGGGRFTGASFLLILLQLFAMYDYSEEKYTS